MFIESEFTAAGNNEFSHLVLQFRQLDRLERRIDFLELELGGREKGDAHEDGEDGVAGHVVPVDYVFRAARVIGEDVGVVEGDPDEEHGDRPAQGPVHPLPAVVLDVVLEVAQRGGVRHRDGGRAEELSEYLKSRTFFRSAYLTRKTNF